MLDLLVRLAPAKDTWSCVSDRSSEIRSVFVFVAGLILLNPDPVGFRIQCRSDSSEVRFLSLVMVVPWCVGAGVVAQ